MIVKVISGGQTGVDIAALRAAKSLGIKTGGTMPKHWITLDGKHPEYAEKYGMKESFTAGYESRTFQNVIDSHATLQVAYDFNTRGELCTSRAIREHDRERFKIGLNSELVVSKIVLFEAVAWLRGLGDLVLNVAGNSEDNAPGIEASAEKILKDLFRMVNCGD